MRSLLGKAAAITLPLAVLACAVALVARTAGSQTPQAGAAAVSCPARVWPKPPYVGVSPDRPWNASLARFERATKVRVSIAESYLAFGSPFPSRRACEMARRGGFLLVQMNPRHVPLLAIAAGRYDRYLTGWAQAAKSAGAPVALSLAHEFNGRWSPWGYGHVAPRVFAAAWRRAHDVVAKAGARNVVWIWNPNRASVTSREVAPPRAWWPGGRYVDLVALDGYYDEQDSTFRRVFGPTLRGLGAYANKPVLIAETGTAGPAQARQIRDLFAGVRRNGILGLVWFEMSRREHWPIEENPAAVAAFRRGVAGMLAGNAR